MTHNAVACKEEDSKWRYRVQEQNVKDFKQRQDDVDLELIKRPTILCL
jgi:hypothetical protein